MGKSKRGPGGRFLPVPWWAKPEFITHAQCLGYGLAAGLLIGASVCLMGRF